jgi:glutathione S-transferase
MYELFIANKNYSSWSLRPWVLMKGLSIPFEERLIPFAGAGRANFEAFKKVSPSAKVPSLKDGETIVWDSLAIAEYLHERHPGVWPKDGAARAWARSAAAEMHSGFTTLRGTCNMNCGIRVRMKSVPEGVTQDLARLGELWNDGLKKFGGPFLAGKDFTNADAFFCPVAYRVQTYGLAVDAISQLYLQRLLALPAMQEWYKAGLAETTRIERYEDDARAAGEVTEDLRAAA